MATTATDIHQKKDCSSLEEWDDGEELFPEEWSMNVWCLKCGRTPRPEHKFRCRACRDDLLENADTRPVYPEAPVWGDNENEEDDDEDEEEEERQLEERNKLKENWTKEMNEWTPVWKECEHCSSFKVEDEENAKWYALPCVRCGSKTLQGGKRTKGFGLSMDKLRSESSHLGNLDGYGEGITRVKTSTGEFGKCYRCLLGIDIEPGEDE
eukprot:GFYU01012729.1.p1 GENE.GFYU01012729.1~~GFYU01012729.1.p1  ORF type:complete len:210 (-),score=45.69 GFYU01012729.1:39-668(-)